MSCINSTVPVLMFTLSDISFFSTNSQKLVVLLDETEYSAPHTCIRPSPPKEKKNTCVCCLWSLQLHESWGSRPSQHVFPAANPSSCPALLDPINSASSQLDGTFAFDVSVSEPGSSIWFQHCNGLLSFKRNLWPLLAFCWKNLIQCDHAESSVATKDVCVF